MPPTATTNRKEEEEEAETEKRERLLPMTPSVKMVEKEAQVAPRPNFQLIPGRH